MSSKPDRELVRLMVVLTLLLYLVAYGWRLR